MIDKHADIFPGELPETIKDILWDDEKGFFENALAWGGWLLPAPIMIANVAAGMAGFGLSDFGRKIDEVLAGQDVSMISPRTVAEDIANSIYPAIEARAGSMLSDGMVVIAVKPADVVEEANRRARYRRIVEEEGRGRPSPITFEKPGEGKAPLVTLEPAQPAQTEVPKPVELPPTSTSTLPKKPVPSPIELDEGAQQKDELSRRKDERARERDVAKFEHEGEKENKKHKHEKKKEKKRSRHQKELLELRQTQTLERDEITSAHKRALLAQEAQLRALQEAQANAHREELAVIKARMTEAERAGNVERMSEVHREKYALEDRAVRTRSEFELHRELAAGNITKEQHGILVKQLHGIPASDQEIERARRSADAAQDHAWREKMKQQDLERKHSVKHHEELAKIDRKNAKLSAAARAGEPGLISVFKRGVGKAGLIAALIAIIAAGAQMISKGGGSHFPVPTTPSIPLTKTEDDDLPTKLRSRVKPLTQQKAPAAKPAEKSKPDIRSNIDSELKRILGG